MASMRVSDIFSLMWSITSSRLVDCCRNIKSEVVTVTTKAGRVKGYKVNSSFAYQYINFFGIPYAKPPVGDLRFKVRSFRYLVILKTILLPYIPLQNPQPFEPIENDEFINLQFHRDNSMACQNDIFLQRPTGAENCLHLSVFTRDIEPAVLRPVMVWIHGGAFILGSNTKLLSNPEYLLRNDVVVVSINYRLGAHGE